MGRITTNSVAVGFAGAMTDVSSSADLDEGVPYSWGRESEFEDTRPSEFSFTLDNADGKFTPDNTASSLPSPLTEGMLACWQLGSRLVSGRIREIKPVFPDGESAWAQVQLTCDDDLGAMARTDLGGSLTAAMVSGAGVYAFWPFDDAAGTSEARETSGYTGSGYPPRPFNSGIAPTFGVGGVDAVGTSQAEFSALAGNSTSYTITDVTTPRTGLSPFFAITDGWVSFWLTPMNYTSYFELDWDVLPSSTTFSIQNGNFVLNDSWVATTYTVPFNAGQSYFIALNYAGSFYVDGVLIGSYASNLLHSALAPTIVIGNSAYGDSVVRISQLAQTVNRPLGQYAASGTTESNRLLAIEQAAGLDLTPSASLSDRIIGLQSAGSVLDALNEIVLTEQGHVYTKTTGTLTAPVQTTIIRDRTRPTTYTYTFDAERELDGAPDLVRDLTDMVSQVTVNGTDTTVTVKSSGKFTNAQLTARVGTANTSEDVLNITPTDLTAWGEDRLNRGANIQIRVAELTINAMTTPTDRSADLLAMLPGDRIRITNLPNTQLNFTTWDGWLLGATEQHTTTEHTFTIYLAPVMVDTAIYDSTNRFHDNGELTLSAGINAAVTTMSVASSATAAALLTVDPADLPALLQIDSEKVTVTNITAATPQVVTMARGAAGTTAAPHLAGAVVSSGEADTLFAF